MQVRTLEVCCEDHYNAEWAVLGMVFAHKFNEICECPSAFLFSEARLQGETAGRRASVDPCLPHLLESLVLSYLTAGSYVHKYPLCVQRYGWPEQAHKRNSSRRS